MNKNVYFVDFDTGAREMSDSTDFRGTPIEDFIDDKDVVSSLHAGCNPTKQRFYAMEILAHFFHNHTKHWLTFNKCYWTVYEFRVIEEAVDKFERS